MVRFTFLMVNLAVSNTSQPLPELSSKTLPWILQNKFVCFFFFSSLQGVAHHPGCKLAPFFFCFACEV